MVDNVKSVVQPPLVFQSVVEPALEMKTVVEVGQGPAGPKGLSGDGIDNYPSDPLAIYILAKS